MFKKTTTAFGLFFYLFLLMGSPLLGLHVHHANTDQHDYPPESVFEHTFEQGAATPHPLTLLNDTPENLIFGSFNHSLASQPALIHLPVITYIDHDTGHAIPHIQFMMSRRAPPILLI